MSSTVWSRVQSLIPSSRCPTCPGDKRCVPCDGPSNYSPQTVFFIGEAPGKDEDKHGRPFIGRAGKEYNHHYLQLAGLDRSSIYITNTVKCRPPNNRKPSTKEIQSCGGHFLPHELSIANPDIVVLMGGTATSLAPNLDLETHHGRAQTRPLFGVDRTVFCTYHPALGLHSTGKIRQLRQDFMDLGRFLTTGWRGETDQYPKTTYSTLTPDLASYLLDSVSIPTVHLATDTESIQPSPHSWRLWSWQVSVDPGVSILGWANDHDSMALYQRLLTLAPSIIMHNAPYDIAQLRRIGLSIRDYKVTDTMEMAYRLGESQKLKALAYRLCGMEMRTYDEVVMPYSRMKVMEWLTTAILELPPLSHTYTTPKKKETKTKLVKNPAESEVLWILNHMDKSDTYDPWKRWETVKLDLSAQDATDKDKSTLGWMFWLENRLGPMPRAGLDQIPLPEATHYAMRDSDANLRVYLELDNRENALGNDVSPYDYDTVIITT